MGTRMFTVEQIAHALKRVEAGIVFGEVCREMGITEPTFYRRKKTFGGISTPELRQLRNENRRLKGAVAEPTLDRTMLQEALLKEADQGDRDEPCELRASPRAGAAVCRRGASQGRTPASGVACSAHRPAPEA